MWTGSMGKDGAMAVVINMSKMRKAMDRAKKQAEANANAARFGRTAAEKSAEAFDLDRASTALDGKKRSQE